MNEILSKYRGKFALRKHSKKNEKCIVMAQRRIWDTKKEMRPLGFCGKVQTGGKLRTFETKKSELGKLVSVLTGHSRLRATLFSNASSQ